MSSLIYNNTVLSIGLITDDGDRFTSPDSVVFKNLAPTAFIVNEEPPGLSDTGWYFDNGKFIKIPLPEIDHKIQQQNVQKAKALLQATDWSAINSVADQSVSNPFLTNQNEFLSYRSAVRAICINPPETLASFPNTPVAIWSV